MTLVSAIKQTVEAWWNEDDNGMNPPKHIMTMIEWVMKINKEQFNLISGKWDSLSQ